MFAHAVPTMAARRSQADELEQRALAIRRRRSLRRAGQQRVDPGSKSSDGSSWPSSRTRSRLRHSSTEPPSLAASAIAVSVSRPLTANWRPVRRSQASKYGRSLLGEITPLPLPQACLRVKISLARGCCVSQQRKRCCETQQPPFPVLSLPRPPLFPRGILHRLHRRGRGVVLQCRDLVPQMRRALEFQPRRRLAHFFR